MSIEDSLILSTLLGRSRTQSDATAALRAYDEIRRPRTQRIVDASRTMGLLLTGRDEEARLSAKEIGRKSDGFFGFIHDLDVEKHREEAIKLMDEIVQAE